MQFSPLATLMLLSVITLTIGEKKLQIGVKKRVQDCTVKSRNGDKLHMHYTVSFSLYPVNMLTLVCGIV